MTCNKPTHDGLIKAIMTSPEADEEFLEYYLPKGFKEKVDLSKIKVE